VHHKNQPAGKPWIQITFTDAGASEFAKSDPSNIGKRLAIIIDLAGFIPPRPQSGRRFRAAQAQVTGNFSEQEANDLATKLNQSRDEIIA